MQRDLDFGRRLIETMRTKRVSITELAVRLPAHSVTISKWRGGQVPAPARLARLAGLLGVSAEWLRTGNGPTSPPEEELAIVRAQRIFREVYGTAALELAPYVESGRDVPPSAVYALLRQVFEAGMEAIRRPEIPAEEEAATTASPPPQ